MARWLKVLIVAAAALLLVANGACALAGIVSIGQPPLNYSGMVPGLLGIATFYLAVPLGLAAVVAAAMRDASPARRTTVALLLAALALPGAWLLAVRTGRGGEISGWPYILAFSLATLAAGAVLVVRRRR